MDIITHNNTPPLTLAESAAAIIEEEYAYISGIAELAERVYATPEHLIRRFRARYGVPPHKYLTRVRIDAAKALLIDYDYKIEVIANLCGFADANYFCKVFRKYESTSPGRFRDQNSAPREPEPAIERDFEAY